MRVVYVIKFISVTETPPSEAINKKIKTVNENTIHTFAQTLTKRN